jgi:hypothetical protein
VKAIESLEFTVKADPRLVQKLKMFNYKRNKSSYDMAGAVSDQELEAVVKLATELKNNVMKWLKEVHPELLEFPSGCDLPAKAQRCCSLVKE